MLQVFIEPGLKEDIYAGGVDLDYVGDEVSVDSLARILTNRHFHWMPRSTKHPLLFC